MSGVIVLNATYEHHQLVSVPHAIRMLHRQVAVLEEGDSERTIGPWPWPRVLRLVRYVYARWIHSPRPTLNFSRQGVLRRDRFRCAYCNGHASTIDHVLPRSRGGKTIWLNCVAACEPCNSRKGSRTPAEAEMLLLWKATLPG